CTSSNVSRRRTGTEIASRTAWGYAAPLVSRKPAALRKSQTVLLARRRTRTRRICAPSISYTTLRTFSANTVASTCECAGSESLLVPPPPPTENRHTPHNPRFTRRPPQHFSRRADTHVRRNHA